jgi:hypothetical protein
MKLRLEKVTNKNGLKARLKRKQIENKRLSMIEAKVYAVDDICKHEMNVESNNDSMFILINYNNSLVVN